MLDYKPLFPTQNNSSDAACEIDNSWEEDSIIGFEASEEYVFDNEFAEWKINETTLSLRRIKEYLR